MLQMKGPIWVLIMRCCFFYAAMKWIHLISPSSLCILVKKSSQGGIWAIYKVANHTHTLLYLCGLVINTNPMSYLDTKSAGFSKFLHWFLALCWFSTWKPLGDRTGLWSPWNYILLNFSSPMRSMRSLTVGFLPGLISEIHMETYLTEKTRKCKPELRNIWTFLQLETWIVGHECYQLKIN